MIDISDRAHRLSLIPPEVKPRCAWSCTMLLVVLTDILRAWRCERCDRMISIDPRPVSAQGSLF